MGPARYILGDLSDLGAGNSLGMRASQAGKPQEPRETPLPMAGVPRPSHLIFGPSCPGRVHSRAFLCPAGSVRVAQDSSDGEASRATVGTGMRKMSGTENVCLPPISLKSVPDTLSAPRRRPKQADRPRLREWKESHDPVLLHPVNAVVNLQEGNARRSRLPDTVREKKSVCGVTARRDCFCNPWPLSL
jgi:hypothetical protein